MTIDPTKACGPDCKMAPPTGLDDASGDEHQDCPEPLLCETCHHNGVDRLAVYPGNEFGCPPMCEECAMRAFDSANLQAIR